MHIEVEDSQDRVRVPLVRLVVVLARIRLDRAPDQLLLEHEVGHAAQVQLDRVRVADELREEELDRVVVLRLRVEETKVDIEHLFTERGRDFWSQLLPDAWQRTVGAAYLNVLVLLRAHRLIVVVVVVVLVAIATSPLCPRRRRDSRSARRFRLRIDVHTTTAVRRRCSLAHLGAAVVCRMQSTGLQNRTREKKKKRRGGATARRAILWSVRTARIGKSTSIPDK